MEGEENTCGSYINTPDRTFRILGFNKDGKIMNKIKLNNNIEKVLIGEKLYKKSNLLITFMDVPGFWQNSQILNTVFH